MLTEFAITLEVLEQADDPAAREHLRDLGKDMFPRNSASPVILADLCGGSWFAEARNAVERIKDHAARAKAKGLLTKLKEILVNRPYIGVDYPTNEQGWVRQAMATSKMERIARIVATPQVYGELRGSCPQLHSLENTARADFWEGVRTCRPVPPSLDEQIRALRSICVHAGFIAFASPYILGGSDDDTDFVKRLIRSALKRPEGFQSPLIDIHTEGPDKPGSSDFQVALQNRVDNVVESLQGAISGGGQIRLFVWQKLLERVLLAGDNAPDPGQPSSHWPRWGVSFTHVAREWDKLDAYRATFALLDKEGKEFWHKKLYLGSGTQLLKRCDLGER